MPDSWSSYQERCRMLISTIMGPCESPCHITTKLVMREGLSTGQNLEGKSTVCQVIITDVHPVNK